MANVKVCVRFRPLSSKERRDHGDGICIRSLDSETFVFKDEKLEESAFSFDRVFYEESEQSEVFEFLALPIVQDVVSGINGTIIAYGQTGAGKTHSMEGPGILDFDEQKKGLLPRVVDELFNVINVSEDQCKWTVKLSMVEIYMDKVRDLFDLSKDNIRIKESKVQGILLSGVTEVCASTTIDALQSLLKGVANRAVGETQMNMASSRSHCVYIFNVQGESSTDMRVKTAKLVLVDLAGSEKIEKTGAKGKVLEEAKTINKSLSALGNVINALTCGTPSKANHIPYRDSKLTRILQDALGGNSRTALLCCCSPSPSNASESLSTLRFGARAKYIKTMPRINCKEEIEIYANNQGAPTLDNDKSCERILEKLREKLDVDDVKLLEELFILDGIFADLSSAEDLQSAFEDVTSRTISSLQEAVEDLAGTVEELKIRNKQLKYRLESADRNHEKTSEDSLGMQGNVAKHIKTLPRINCKEETYTDSLEAPTLDNDKPLERILEKLRERLDVNDVKLLEEIFIQEGILVDLSLVEDLQSACEADTSRLISSLHQAVEELARTVEELQRENKQIKDRLESAKRTREEKNEDAWEKTGVLHWVRSFLIFL